MKDSSRVVLKVLQVHSEADTILAKIPKTVKVSCRRGCTGCCYQIVAMQFEEAVAIAKHVVDVRSPAVVADLLARLDEQAAILKERRKTRADFFLNRRPCAFLANDDCSIYKVRPITCRAHYVVSDPALCAPDATYDCEIVDVRVVTAQCAMKLRVSYNVVGPMQPFVAEAIRCFTENREPSLMLLEEWSHRFRQMLLYDRAQMARHNLTDKYV